jgi:hypothetical protein
MAPDRIEKIEAIDPGAGHVLRLLTNYIRLKEGEGKHPQTTEGLRQASADRRQAADLFDSMRAAMKGEEIEQGGLPFE